MKNRLMFCEGKKDKGSYKDDLIISIHTKIFRI